MKILHPREVKFAAVVALTVAAMLGSSLAVSCGGESANTARDVTVLATAEAVTVACPRVYDAIVEDTTVSIDERRTRLRGARFACEMLLHEIARSAQ